MMNGRPRGGMRSNANGVVFRYQVIADGADFGRPSVEQVSGAVAGGEENLR